MCTHTYSEENNVYSWDGLNCVALIFSGIFIFLGAAKIHIIPAMYRLTVLGYYASEEGHISLTFY